MKKFTTSISALLCVAMASADAIDDADGLMLSGDYDAARSILMELLETAPKNQIGRVNYMLGECDFQLGDLTEARTHLNVAKSKGIGDANLLLGRIAFLDYDFDTASELYAAYSAAMKKAKKQVSDDLEAYEGQLGDAESFLERVEQLTVIDSIAVPKTDFFKAYKIPVSAGLLRGGDEFPDENLRDEVEYFFTNEGDDFMMWTQPDSLGVTRIMEATRLTDGKWGDPVMTSDILSLGGDEAYPFMMSDGVTLYYASDGDGSIGGYDIFVASRDATDGSYLQPQNIGMPYNSPYDDYLLAIDELNGVGWWATDRNQLGDDLTVYVYLINDLRKNYDPDAEDIVEMARISDWKATQPEDADYSELLATIADIQPGVAAKKADFYFPMPGGVTYTTLDDFKSIAARSAFKKYEDALKAQDADLASLRSLRMKYHQSPSDRLKSEIMKLEKKTENQRTALTHLRSDVYRAEK